MYYIVYTFLYIWKIKIFLCQVFSFRNRKNVLIIVLILQHSHESILEPRILPGISLIYTIHYFSECIQKFYLVIFHVFYVVIVFQCDDNLVFCLIIGTIRDHHGISTQFINELHLIVVTLLNFINKYLYDLATFLLRLRKG